jgi:AcrR family transcriptional regulator
MSAAGTRARVRAELTREIAEVARAQLAANGAAALSLRAVARELGMASSAVYRYFASRDELLTALIIDAYNAIGDAAEQADAVLARGDLRGRWRGVCTAIRAWALTHPHEYALVYGSPVPGYTAPEATIEPASRVDLVLCAILADGIRSGALDATPDGSGADATLTPGLATMIGLPDEPTGSIAVRAIHAWSSVLGLLTFELFGHAHNVVADHEAFYADAVQRIGTQAGLPT